MRTACSSSFLLGCCLPKCMVGHTPPSLGLEEPLGLALETPHPQNPQPHPGYGPEESASVHTGIPTRLGPGPQGPLNLSLQIPP